MSNETKKRPTLKNYYWINYFDETADRCVSDWDKAAECTHCGRAIVYVCEMSDGSILGRACAFKELGLTGRTIDEHVAAKAKAERNRKGWSDTCRKYALPTPQEAVAACLQRNKGFNGAYTGHCWIARFETGFYAVPAHCTTQIQDAIEIINTPTQETPDENQKPQN